MPVHELRIYTINRGMMDAWLACFQKDVAPLSKQFGIPIVASWTNTDRTEFIWVRTFADEDDRKRRTESLYGSSAWEQMKDRVRSHIAKTEVRAVEPTSFSPLK
ncbi:MAG: NIPSNAP family protein [Chloroflexi bacterium]|nr:NIPSNAP family protein [Chloroflexota bacterium]